MLRDYNDIISRLGMPIWWDDNGAPRYEPFHPEMCGIYDRYVALLLIECQACGTEYRVASTYTPWDLIRHSAAELPSVEKGVGSFHYGDPPPHCCASGATMNSVPRRVLEFWRRDGEGPEGWDWRRDATHEVEWEEEEGWEGVLEEPETGAGGEGDSDGGDGGGGE